jgi:hypothetical protein
MVAGKYALFIGIQLSSMGILKATSFALLLLIGFGAAFGIYWLMVTGLEFLAKKVNTARITKPLGALIVFMQTTLFSSFLLFILMQFTFMQSAAQHYLSKSVTYPKIASFYTNVLSVNFVHSAIMGNSSAIDTKELLLKTIKQAFK